MFHDLVEEHDFQGIDMPVKRYSSGMHVANEVNRR